jgi:hypothetical protein
LCGPLNTSVASHSPRPASSSFSGAPFVETDGSALAPGDLRHALPRADVDAQLPVWGSRASQKVVAPAVDVSVRPGAELRVGAPQLCKCRPDPDPSPRDCALPEEDSAESPARHEDRLPDDPGPRNACGTAAGPHLVAGPQRLVPGGRHRRDAHSGTRSADTIQRHTRERPEPGGGHACGRQRQREYGHEPHRRIVGAIIPASRLPSSTGTRWHISSTWKRERPCRARERRSEDDWNTAPRAPTTRGSQR